jgi:hypothetical protein
MEKICNVCNFSKPINQFYKNRTARYGVSSLCKECAKARTKNRNIEAPEIKKAHRKKYLHIQRSLQQESYKENPAKWLAFAAARRRATRLAIPKWADRKAILEFYENCPEGMTVDHIIPLRSELVCGLHVEYNLQYLTGPENSAKSNLWWPDMPD